MALLACHALSVSPTLAQPPGIEHVYDAAGRLVGVVNQSGDMARYVYDAVGNLLSIERVNVADRPAGAVAITGVFPKAGPVGTVVAIVGRGFSTNPGADEVRFNGVQATVSGTTATRITTTVPAGATTGFIRVTVDSTSTDSPRIFRVVGAVTLTPASASIPELGTVQFSATEVGNPAASFTWRVNGVSGGNAGIGTITPTGLYTAPSRSPSPRAVTITAAPVDAPSSVASATLTVLGAPETLALSSADVSVTITAAESLATLVSTAVSVKTLPPAPALDTLAATAVSVTILPPAPSLATFTGSAEVSIAIAPLITRVTPATGTRGQTVSMTLSGAGFAGATSSGLAFLRDSTPDASITTTTLTVNADGTQATAQVVVGSASVVGPRVIRITTPGGSSTAAGTGANLFAVQ